MMIDRLRNDKARRKAQARKELKEKIVRYVVTVAGCAVAMGFCWAMMSFAILLDNGVL